MPTSRQLTRVSLIAVLAVAGVASTGCHRSLFGREMTRTQFETYERVRQQNTDPVEPDVFGNPRPALRQRLSRK